MKVLALIIALLLPTIASADPVCTSVGTAASELGSGAILTVPNVTVPSSSGYLVAMFAYRSRTITVTSVVRAGQTFTVIGSKVDADDQLSTKMYRYKNPTVSTADVVITLSGTLTGSGAAGILFCTGVDQSTSEGTVQTAEADTGDLGVTVSSATGELVISVGAKNDGANQPVAINADDETVLFNVTSTAGTGLDVVVAGSYQAGAASVEMLWGGTNNPMGVIGIPLKAAPPPDPITSTRQRQVMILP